MAEEPRLPDEMADNEPFHLLDATDKRELIAEQAETKVVFWLIGVLIVVAVVLFLIFRFWLWR
jgi:hypothetical protein